jgi:Tfp pilus assembly protein PilF
MSVPSALTIEKANELFATSQFPAAADAFRQIAEQQPTNGVAWRGLALSLIQSGQLLQAIEPCQKAVQLLPASPECRYAYGYVLGADRRYSEAIPELDAALQLQANNVPAKQALVYALVQHGKSQLDQDPRMAENYLERPFKLDHRSSATAAPLLELLFRTRQKGKAANLLAALDADLKQDPSLQSWIEQMHADPEFHAVLHQAETAAKAANVKPQPLPAASHPTIQTVPCPNCRQPIADYAAICPFCSFRNRATGTFAGRDTGPTYAWQDIALTVVAIVWILYAGLGIVLAIRADDFLRDYLLTIQIANGGIGLGLLFRMEWLMMIAKYLCYLNLLIGAYQFIFGLMLANWAALGAGAFTLALAGFLVYLINFNSDV